MSTFEYANIRTKAPRVKTKWGFENADVVRAFNIATEFERSKITHCIKGYRLVQRFALNDELKEFAMKRADYCEKWLAVTKERELKAEKKTDIKPKAKTTLEMLL